MASCGLCLGAVEVAAEAHFRGNCLKCGDVILHDACAAKHAERYIQQRCNTYAARKLKVSRGRGVWGV